MPHSSLLSRKRDLLYFTYFAIAVPIVFLVDLQAIYPPWMVPEMLQTVKNYYIEAYHDRFFVDPNPFFRFFISIELLYQVPVMVWGLRALYQNSPKVPLVLLPLALVTFLTTLTCMVEYAFWPQFSAREKVNLTSLYAPYLLLWYGSTFCAGADLKEWKQNIDNGVSVLESLPPTGFGGLSRRAGKKPIIVAVNGICFGGGFEMVINADLVIADEVAQFALPEVKIGVAAIGGALTRLVRTVGKQRAMEICLTGRTLSAGELKDWGILNKVVKNGECVNEAIKMAQLISKNSPDSVICSKDGVNMGWQGLSAEEGTNALLKGTFARMNNGENMAEGVKSFFEKRYPIWAPSKI